MFVVNEDKSVYVTRGDVCEIPVQHQFNAGDIVRIKITKKKDCESVVMQRDFDIQDETDSFVIFLNGDDTKLGEVISKPTDYWYEIELNPDTHPETIVGYDEDGAKVFRLFPEGKDVDGEDIEVVGHKTLQELVDYALEQAKESGEFKGEKGDKGDTGYLGNKTAEGGEIFNFYTNPVYTGDNPPKEFPGNTAAKGSHAEGFGTHADGQYAHAEGWVSTASGGIAHAEGREAQSTGYASHAEGRETVASGYVSHAEGWYSKAEGQASHAEGYSTEARLDACHAEGEGTVAYGCHSAHAEGYYTKAHGDYGSHAEGNLTEATGMYSHAEGRYSKAQGTASHAEGDESKASGDFSHAEGQYTEATAMYAHAEGFTTHATGSISHAEGTKTTASGYASHAEGHSAKASGYASHAEGISTEASGYASHAQGRGTKATCRYQNVQGRFNVPDAPLDNDGNGTYAHIVGGGDGDTARKNIYALDWNGNAEFAGKVYSGGKELATVEAIEAVLRKHGLI